MKLFQILLLLLSMPLSRADSDAKPGLFGMERPRDTDLLVLQDGGRLAGALENKTFSLRTAYALLKFDRPMLAGINLRAGAQNGEVLVSVNGDRFSGFLEESNFIVQTAAGVRTQLRREKAALVLFQDRGGAPDGKKPGLAIHLKNGDMFHGGFGVESLVLDADGRAETVATKDIRTLAFTTNQPPSAVVTLLSGKTVRGVLQVEDIPFRFDLGPTLALYRDSIRSIGEEPALQGSISSASASPEAADTRAVAPQTGSTNIPGMVWIPAGEFTMGSSIDEAGRDADEGPQTRVVIPQGFWMGRCEVTQGEYLAVTGVNPSNARGDTNCPVEKVNWYDAMQYCVKRTQQEQSAGRLPDGFVYRLPTEAEWEYACRAGTATRFCYGDDKGEFRLGEHAWFVRNSDSMTHPAGALKPNAWGLRDMHGNVWEWCCDRMPGILPGGSITNYPATASGSLRVARGGSWLYEGKACRSANRDDYGPSNRCSDVGFRVVLAPL